MKGMKRGNIAAYIVIALFIILLLFPLYIMLKISLSAPSDMFAEDPPYIIKNLTFGHFKDVFASGDRFISPFKKSLITAFLASLLSLMISVPAAYGISRFNYKIKYIFILIIFFTRMMPEISLALPISIIFIRSGLFDTIPGLTLAHLIRILPISCFILVGVFSSLPIELEKQARIDGCSRLQALRKVVIPLSWGGVSVAWIFSFLFSWDEFIYASYLTLAKPTMPIKMYYYISRGDIFYSATYAVIITIPVLLMTFAMQKYIRPGYFSGAMKG